MATSKDIEIILKAKLDQGNAVDSAKSLGNDIAKALDNAFDGLGEKIASKLMLEMRGVLSNVRFSELFSNNDYAQNLRQQASIGSGPILDQFQRPISSGVSTPAGIPSAQFGPSPQGANVNIPPTPPAPSTGSAPALMKEALSASSNFDSKLNFAYATKYGLGLSSGPFSDITGPLSGTMDKATTTARSQQDLFIDSTAAQFRAYNSLRKIDPTQKMDPELAKNLGEARQLVTGRAEENFKNIIELTKEIATLTATVRENSGKLAEANSKKPSERTEEDNKIIQASADLEAAKDRVAGLQNAQRDMTNFSAQVDAFNRERQSASPGSGMGGILSKVAIGSELLSLGFRAAADAPILRAQSAAGTGRLRDFSGSDVISGNIEGMIATSLLGGEENLKQTARGSATNQIISNIAGSVASFAGAAGAATLGGPGNPVGIMGAVGLGSLGLSQGYSAYKDIQNFDSAVVNKMREMQSLKVAENEVLMKSTAAAYDFTAGKYGMAQSMGAPEISASLISLSKPSPKYTDEQYKEDIQKKYFEPAAAKQVLEDDKPAARLKAGKSKSQYIRDYEENFDKSMESTFEGLKNQADTRLLNRGDYAKAVISSGLDITDLSKIKKDDQNKINENLAQVASQRSKEDFQKKQGLRNFFTSKDIGGSNEAFDATMGNMLSGMGGYFPTAQNPDERNPFQSERMQGSLKNLLTLQARGFTNASGIATSLYNQTMPYAGGATPAEDRGRATDQASYLYQKMIGSGVDKLSVNEYLGNMAGQMDARGFGSESLVTDITNRSLNVSNQLFGSNLNAKQLQAVTSNLFDFDQKTKQDTSTAIFSAGKTISDIRQNDKFKDIPVDYQMMSVLQKSVGTDFEKGQLLNKMLPEGQRKSDEQMTDFVKEFRKRNSQEYIETRAGQLGFIQEGKDGERKINFEKLAASELGEGATIEQINLKAKTLQKTYTGEDTKELTGPPDLRSLNKKPEESEGGAAFATQQQEVTEKLTAGMGNLTTAVNSAITSLVIFAQRLDQSNQLSSPSFSWYETPTGVNPQIPQVNDSAMPGQVPRDGKNGFK